MPKVAYHLTLPENRSSAVVFASPHSGRDYPWTFLRKTRLNALSIRSSEDAFVDQLFEYAVHVGSPFLRAGAPRAFIDYNRNTDELDPALILDVPKGGHNPRVASGLGIIPRVVANGQEIYSGKIPLSEAQHRIETYWQPYHRVLGQQLELTRSTFGQAILVDCHSMPHEALDQVSRGRAKRPDVVLGDRFGAAADGEIVDRIEAALVAAGLTVIRNAPFAGAFVTQRYGRPNKGFHAVQIEVDRALYMNERLVRPNGNFNAVRRMLRQVISDIADIGRKDMRPLAAE